MPPRVTTYLPAATQNRQSLSRVPMSSIGLSEWRERGNGRKGERRETTVACKTCSTRNVIGSVSSRLFTYVFTKRLENKKNKMYIISSTSLARDTFFRHTPRVDAQTPLEIRIEVDRGGNLYNFARGGIARANRLVVTSWRHIMTSSLKYSFFKRSDDVKGWRDELNDA